jgi:outer membrane protein assembly factor BamD (BamD/ComL family)
LSKVRAARTIRDLMPRVRLRPLPLTTLVARTAIVLAVACGAATCLAQTQRYELDALDQWKKVADVDPASEEAQILAARRALIAGEPKRAEKLANAFLERSPLSRYRADALLIRGDAKRGEDEYEALFDYEEICRRYAGTAVFIPALERQYEIALDYANGLRRRFFGTVRIVDTTEDAQELLIRVQERLPGSELAERACMQLADFYFNRREMIMAAETYRIFMENFPRSAEVSKARLRLIYAYLAGFRGPEYDASGLLEARARLRTLQALQPGLAQQVGRLPDLARHHLVEVVEKKVLGGVCPQLTGVRPLQGVTQCIELAGLELGENVGVKAGKEAGQTEAELALGSAGL